MKKFTFKLQPNERITFMIEDKYVGSYFNYEEKEIEITAYAVDFKVNFDSTYIWPTSFTISTTGNNANEEKDLITFNIYKAEIIVREMKKDIIKTRLIEVDDEEDDTICTYEEYNDYED